MSTGQGAPDPVAPRTPDSTRVPDLARVPGVVVRVARDPREIADAGALTAEAYHADRLLDEDDDYEVELRDAARRAREATLLVAVVPAAAAGAAVDADTVDADTVDADTVPAVPVSVPVGAAPVPHGPAADVVVGTLTLAPYGSSYAEVAEPGEVELRMLAVAPEARRRGVAELLMSAALREVVATGGRRVVLSTLDAMTTAQRLYQRLGFVAAPQRDWGHEGIRLRVRTWQAPVAPGVLVESATWPAVRSVDVDGWRLGLSGGFTRRANCVLALGSPADVEGALDAVERTYTAVGLPSVVRVCAAARPLDLDDRLERRGYQVVARTDVLVRPLVAGRVDDGRVDDRRVDEARVDAGRTGSVRARGAGDRVRDGAFRIDVGTEPDDDWLAGWLDVKSPGRADVQTARAIVAGAPALYATARDGAGVVGVIRAALVDDWVGLSCLMVAPRARRGGVGRALTTRVLSRAVERGATRAFLQVEVANAAAGALYGALGFRPAERYHYRTRG
ncbi:GNAT family N-acetyltransferase [Cellulomonas hominis]